ncbi:MAG: hypothetical protein ACREL3_07735 [Gemmatimonadales bacterium]
MDPGIPIALGFLWFLFNLFGKKKPGNPGPGQPARPPASPRTGLPPSTRLDPTQREGVRLQDLLRKLGSTLDESTTEARSLEEEVRRPQRVEVDTDDQAEAVIARRRAAAEANARPLGRADHIAFDERMRREAADATATHATNIAQLRTAVIWSEILGPPIALRESDDR